MAYRTIHLMVSEEKADEAERRLAELDPRNWWRMGETEGANEKLVHFMFVIHAGRAQELHDLVADNFGPDEYRLFSNEVATVLPEPDDEEEQERLENQETAASREEIFANVRDDARLSRDFLAMNAAAGLIAACGLALGQVTVVIGSMVIAPLLAPVMAFAFGITVGNSKTLWTATRSLLWGVAAGAAPGVLMGVLGDFSIDSSIVDTSREIGFLTMAVPLAAGVAAAIMAAQGQRSTLVGVMVSAALLPPLAAFGLLLGTGEWMRAARAIALVALNVAAINLACQVVFMLEGIKPRAWLSDVDGRSIWWGVGASAALAVAMGAIAMMLGGDGGTLIAAR